MAAPISVLQIVQVGLETTRGTLVPATSILDLAPGSAKVTRSPNLIKVRRAGSLATSHRSYPGRDTIAVDIETTASYDWLPWWLNLFLGPLATGAGAGADKTWTFDSTVVSDTADNLKSASIEVGGKDTWPSPFKIAGCVGSKLGLSIKQDEPWSLKASLIGQTVTLGAVTASLSTLSGIKDILGTTTKVYMDSSSAFGTTQRTGTVLSGEISVDLGMEARFTLSGARNASRAAIVKPRAVGAKLVVEWDAITDYNAVHAATAQRLRIVSTGDTLGASNYRAQFDLGGVFDELTFGDDGGVITSELTLAGQYDSSIGSDIAAVVVNASAALP